MSDNNNDVMDIEAHEKTFHGFIKAVEWGAGICIAILIFLAIFNS
ncbi:MAG: aa3-type cytochrome c oxidase subunit IV [Paracoccaceae bacterium]|nr:aa3-type cytochrome c oxidase subunit IV [Paracoccaceae bacterium]